MQAEVEMILDALYIKVASHRAHLFETTCAVLSLGVIMKDILQRKTCLALTQPSSEP